MNGGWSPIFLTSVGRSSKNLDFGNRLLCEHVLVNMIKNSKGHSEECPCVCEVEDSSCP